MRKYKKRQETVSDFHENQIPLPHTGKVIILEQILGFLQSCHGTHVLYHACTFLNEIGWYIILYIKRQRLLLNDAQIKTSYDVLVEFPVCHLTLNFTVIHLLLHQHFSQLFSHIFLS